MAKDVFAGQLAAASQSLIAKLVMITSHLAAGTIATQDFLEAYSEALESFVPDKIAGNDTGATATPLPDAQASAGQA